MTTTTDTPRPTRPRMEAANLARKQTAARKLVVTLTSRWLHLLDDATLYGLAREVMAEVDEREQTRARETTDDDVEGQK